MFCVQDMASRFVAGTRRTAAGFPPHSLLRGHTGGVMKRNAGVVGFLGLFASGCLQLSPSPLNDLGALLAALAIPANPGSKFLAFAGAGVGLESSGDGEWTRFIGSPAVNLSRVVSVESAGSQTLLGIDGTTNNAVFKSTDRGRNWTKVDLTLTVTAPLTRLTACGQKVLAAHANGNALDGVYSSDGGTTWSGPLTLIPTGAATAFGGIACDGATQRFHAMRTANQPSQRFTDTPTGAWSTPTANGLLAMAAYPMVAAKSGVVLYVAQSTGPEIWGSADGGVNYSGAAYLAFGFPTSVLLGQANGAFRVATILGGVCTFHKSVAGTSGWTNVALNSCAATGLNDIRGNGTDTLVAGGVAAGAAFLARSKDGGASWTAENLSSLTGLGGVTALVFVP